MIRSRTSSVVAALDAVPAVKPAAMALTVMPNAAQRPGQRAGHADQAAFGSDIRMVGHDGRIDQIAGDVDDTPGGLGSHQRHHM